MRVQMILALVALLVIIAVPLYLWRRPRPGAFVDLSSDAGATVVDPGDAGGRSDGAAAVPAAPDAGPPTSRVTLGELRTVKCVGERGAKVSPERCEHLTFFEDALTKAVRDNGACAPTTATGGTVSFVLTVDFRHKKTHLWAGKSGTIKKRNATDLVRCVARALPTPEWATLSHQYVRYDVGVLATYPGASGLGATP